MKGINQILDALLSEGHPFRIAACAVSGSIILEIINIYRIYEAGRAFPTRYRRPGFWVVRLLVAFSGGFLALMMRAGNDLIAFQVGMTAPAIVIAMSRRPPESGAGST